MKYSLYKGGAKCGGYLKKILDPEMEGELKNLTIYFSSVIASLCYCYWVSSNVPGGKLRLITLLPILSLFTLLPILSLSSAFTIAIATFFTTWLTNFKLLLFAFGRGPLSWPTSQQSLLFFIATATLPIKIRNTKDQSPQKVPKNSMQLQLAAWVLLFTVFMTLVNDYKEKLHPNAVMVMYCCLDFLLIEVVVAIGTVVLRAVVGGLELEPPSNEPYLSTSLQDFWGRRWNLMATNALRHTVFQPIWSTAFELTGDRRLAMVSATMATFTVSGLVHELLFYYVTRVPPTWEVTSFFMLHGVCVVVESVVMKELVVVKKGKWRLPPYVSRPLTVGFVIATALWLLFPPVIESGADVKILGEFGLFVEFVDSKLNLSNFLGQIWM